MDSSASSSYHHQQQQQQTSSLRPLQGPRPTPLKVSKSSHKIKKPSAGPVPAHPPAAPLPPLPDHNNRQPVIIYAVSPKIIQTSPTSFMSLVQRLTGVNSSPSAAAAAASVSAQFLCPSPAAALSPAAQLATIEKALDSSIPRLPPPPPSSSGGDLDFIDQMDVALDFSANFMGILSPNPTSLPTISPNFFPAPSPAVAPELNSLGFLRDMMSLSPAATGPNRSYADSAFLLSPTFTFTPTAPSPNWDSLLPFPDFLFQ